MNPVDVEVMNQYDMAIELAEHELVCLSILECQDIAREALIKSWLETAYHNPALVEQRYKSEFFNARKESLV